ncbi:MAG: NADPH:quinone reductase [Alphaproteobacteria bacterium]|nr:NADPH:quinone reductase [Alphaproteobacteria bacterium]
MAGTRITVSTQGGSYSAYLAKPAAGKGPGVVVIQEIFGVNKVMRDIADDLAAQGYIALVPDLFWRQQPGIELTDKTEAEWARAFELYKGFNVDLGIVDIQSAIKTLRAMPGCSGKVGSVGYCLGGLLAYLTACRTDADVSVGYYGVGIEGKLAEAANIKGALLLHIAAADDYCKPDAQAKIKEALRGNPHVAIHGYAGMGHAFARIGGQHYNKTAADTANGRTYAAFALHLAGGSTKTTHAFRMHRAGGPEVMQWEEVPLPAPGKGEITVRHTAVGLNFIDTYYRSGLYPSAMPMGIGMEAAGVIEAVGPGVKGFKAGQRVVYCRDIGAYAEKRTMSAERVVALPDGIDDKSAAAMLLKGMTVEYLLRRTYPCKKGQIVLFHAAAGGVGLIFGQWAKAIGVKAIGVVGSPAKAKLAKAHGFAWTIDTSVTKDWVAEVKRITKGAGVPVVYDSVGKDSWAGSIECLAPMGTMVSFGNASGPVPPVPLTQLKGSLFVTRPSLMAYTASRADLEASSKALFQMVKSGKVKIRVNQTYKLTDAPQAHRDLESRKTTGSTVMIP